MTHRLDVTTTFDDGHEAHWFYIQPGTAQDAHDRLAARWKAADYQFTRDRTERVLTHRIEDEERGGPYTDEIRHEDI